MPYTLPDLPYDYGALQPAITGEILELHHAEHHTAYVKGANDTLEQLADAIDNDFGSFEGFHGRLTKATAGVQGSGWGVLAFEPMSRRLVVEQIYDHHGNVGMSTTPLLVFDAWEHDYYLQYRNVRPDYVDKLWDLVDGPDVARRYELAKTSPTPFA